MNKHISNFLLSLTMVLGLTLGLSPTAYAQTAISNLWVGNSDEVTEVGTISNTGGSGTASVSIEGGNVILTLDNFTYKGIGHNDGDETYSCTSPIYYYRGPAPLVVRLIGTNTITQSGVATGNSFGLYYFGNDEVRIEGTGSLTIASGNAGSHSCGIHTSRGITFTGCTVQASGGASSYDYAGNHGVSADGNITVDGASLTAKSGTVTGKYAKSYGMIAFDHSSGPCSVIAKSGTIIAIGSNSALYYNDESYRTSLQIPEGSTWEVLKAGNNDSDAEDINPDEITNQKYIYCEVSASSHTHNFTYSASGSTITATCSEENCSLTDNKVSLTIVAPEMTVSGTAKNANATLTGLEEFNSATGLTVDAADIKYVNRDGGNETSTAPTSAGQYTAKITVEGQTASVDYEILAPVTLTVRSNNEDWGTVEVEGLGNEVVVVWDDMENSGEGAYTKDGVTLTCSRPMAHSGSDFTPDGDNTFTSTLGNFTKIEIYCDHHHSINDGWTLEDGMGGAKLTWTGDAESITLHSEICGILSIKFVFGGTGVSDITANEDGTYTVNPGTEVTIKATPAEGFHLASWSNGAQVNEDGTQKIKVTEDINIVANFTSPFAIAMDTDHKAEAANSEVQNGFEINTYGYCNDNSYRLKYYLLSGEPDQYKVEFDDNRFFDVDWTELATVGPEGTIDLEIPADIPTGDYSMKVTFRNSNYTTFDSEPIEVSFHVNLPETYTVPLYDNVIALVNTCECFTDVQWYHRDNSNADWQAISGATGYYYRQVGGLTGEYFVSAKMNGVSTYTCPQTDVKTLYGAPKKVAKVRVSPNPIENNATVSIEDTENLEHSLRIINVMGNVIEVRTFNGNSTSIDMGAYPTGSYMINVDGIGVKVIRK
ncbi:MAG: T9SS type A sorting domain-containing protein [Bacteroidales bacterium]|nr:T9SS type A sorting domain-containing protein [Bacteroidales bacterium]